MRNTRLVFRASVLSVHLQVKIREEILVLYYMTTPDILSDFVMLILFSVVVTSVAFYFSSFLFRVFAEICPEEYLNISKRRSTGYSRHFLIKKRVCRATRGILTFKGAPAK
jgi:hypothetical protein